ncbi:unnamed protein product [Aspergillus oryzae]|uniref:Unnamed protein product n=1 Tax=Aspergillus oryzae TaxID=5062 RepID=A0AAN4YIR2_ASPOZ|nr:unnamed protein product [Aspergillus oryzae]
METQKNASQPSRRDTCVHRFIGDLNPVVLFVGDGSTRLMRGRAHQRDVGVWLDRENEFIENGENAYHEELSSSMLPLVHEEDFQVQFRNGTVSPYLLQAICLVASKEGEAEPILRLGDRAETMSPCRFSNLLYDDLCHAITMRLERQRMTLIQILALASLHASGPKSFEDASLYLAQAIHHAHTVGLHFLKCGPERHEKPLVTLFWCLWSLDRWIAAIHGRPLVIHDRDLGQQLTDVIDLFDSPFRVWLSLASIMGEVMVVYRPTLDAPVDENKPEIPRFEELIAKCQAEDISLDQTCQSPYAFFLPVRSLNYPSVFRIGVPCNSSSRLTAMGPQGSTEVSRASLEALSSTWWSAQVMTRLGQRALGGMQRVAGRASQLSPSHKKGPAATTSSNCEVYNIGPFHSEESLEEVAEVAHDQQIFADEAVAMTDHQFLFDFEDLDTSGFNNFVTDPMFQDIDDQLGNFLNINIPKCPSDSAFINPDTMWNPDEFDFSCL